ncbi:MAG: GAF domain-containing protein, partial [Anaerolineaceae bacterium]
RPVLLVEDTAELAKTDPQTAASIEGLGYKSYLSVVLALGDRVLGTLNFFYDAPRTFTDADVRLAESIADLMAISMERYKLQATTERRAAELATVTEVGTATTTILELERLLSSVSDLTKERFELYHAHIYLMNEDQTALVLAGGAGEAGEQMVATGHRIPLSREHSLVVQAALRRSSVIANNVEEDENFFPNPLLPDTRSEMAVPMVVGDEVVGVLDVQSAEVNHFDAQLASVQTVLATQIAIAVQNARSFEALERQAESLREVDRLKSQFLANMSHELRTPLNSIIGYSEVLLDGVDGELTEDAEEDVTAIYESGKHLLALINEILDLAKIEAGQMQLDIRAIDMVEFTQEIVKSAQILVKDKPVELAVVEETDMPPVLADSVRLRQILWNLVSNAIKFTEEGSVNVHVDCQDQQALITLRDTGIGMSEEQLDLIFERFSQVDGSSTRRAGGTGLGLTITKQLIELHGGQIEVTSEVGVGSTFRFTLPIHIEEGAEEAT